MASAAEQLASTLNFSAFSKATDLKKRILFTLGALIVYRLGTYIPLSGIDPKAFSAIFQQNSGGILGMFNTFSGGAIQRMSVFALNIMPYISASIIMQLMSTASPTLEALKKQGESGRMKINQYTRYAAVVLAVVQSYGLAVGLESLTSPSGASAVIESGMFFRFMTVITMVAGTMFLMWLGEQMTSRGIGNGISLLIFAGIVAELPRNIISALELSRTGALSMPLLLGIIVGLVLIIMLAVFFERAQRRILVQYPKRQTAQGGLAGGESSHLPLKLNTAGVIPPIFASSLLLMPLTLLGLFSDKGPAWLGDLSTMLAHGQPLYLGLYAFLIIFFCFFYTSIVFNPDETADNLKKYNGFLPGIRPGFNTARYLEYVLSRITVIGAAYICFLCLIPEFLVSKFSIPFYIGGTSLLIVVTVTMDTVTQIHSHMLAHQYEGLMRKARVRGRR